MTTVFIHLPKGSPRLRRYTNAAGITDFGWRILDDLLVGACEPTIEAVLARYDDRSYGHGRDAATKALRSLEDSGLLHRWRRSLGNGVFRWFAVVTDDPYAWDRDPKLKARIARTVTRVLDRVRRRLGIDGSSLRSRTTTPGPLPQVVSSTDSPEVPGIKNPSNQDPKDLSLPPVDKYAARLARILGRDPRLEPHLPGALAALHGLGFAPMARAKHAVVLAETMLAGRALGDLCRELTTGLDRADNPRGLLEWRLRRLRTLVDPQTRNEEELRA